jgi:hypothetical protein
MSSRVKLPCMEGEHRLSPSSWNRFETCPRMHWLSKQGLPKKSGMASSLGTAVHASIEDLLNLDLSDRPRASMGWLPKESACFATDGQSRKPLSTPRRAILDGRKNAGRRPETASAEASTCCFDGSVSKASTTIG